jgi:hypothetical protein
MKKPFFTETTLIRKTSFVRLHMIVHRVLVLLRNVTVRTHVESIRVFCVDISHTSDMVRADHVFNFFVRV